MTPEKQQEVTTEILSSLYKQYTFVPSIPLLLNEIVQKYGWDAKTTAQDLFDAGWARISNNSLDPSSWSAVLTNKGIKEIEPSHFIGQIQDVESHLLFLNNEETKVSEASNIYEPTRVLNLISELNLHSQFIIDNEKQTVKLTDDYYRNTNNGSSFI